MHTIILLTLATGIAVGGLAAPAPLGAQSSTHTAKSTKPKPVAKASSAASGRSAAGATRHPAAKTASTAKGAKSAQNASAVGTAAAPAAAPAGAVAPATSIALRDAPDGGVLATLMPRSTLVPLAHDRGWVRVRAEGWVKESDVSPTDPTRATLSAADLRADPDGSRGKVVHWDVEVLAMETADPLRKGLNPDEPYLLVRGPGTESALLYVAVPAALLATARTVASVAPTAVTLVATVRAGRSEPVGVPILDAQSLVRR